MGHQRREICFRRKGETKDTFMTCKSPLYDTLNSLPPLIKCCINIGKHLDPDFDTSPLNYLLASVEQQCKENSVEFKRPDRFPNPITEPQDGQVR